MRCLIVEDEALIREGLKSFLVDKAEIVTASNGREAVRAFTDAFEIKKPYDMVLLDIVMPEMDGQMALKLMRLVERQFRGGQDKKTIIIMTTAVNSIEEVQEAMWMGDCTDYLVKPFVREDLIALLTRYGLT